jgi:hypothetical protein
MKKGIIGCLGVFLVTGLVTAVLIGVWLFTEKPLLDASLSIPSEIEIDSTVAMVITVTNPHDESVVLDSIDIGNAFLEGFLVVSILPEPVDTMSIFGERSWEFGEDVAPGASLEIHFKLKAIQQGHFSGDIGTYNPNQDFQTLFADVVVRKTAAQAD